MQWVRNRTKSIREAIQGHTQQPFDHISGLAVLTLTRNRAHLAGAMQARGALFSLVPWIPRAVFELLRARITLVRLTPKRLLALNSQAGTMTVLPSHAHSRRAEALGRITFLVPRIAARLPWRSDCLVQALAAQRWLLAHSVAATIEIGVQRDAKSEFRAHAWLLHQGQVVLGGEAGDFTPLLAQE